MRTRPATLALAVALVTGLASLGARGAPPRGARASNPRVGQPFLWRVEKSGPPSYLFGTVHAGVDLDAALGPEGLMALDSADRVFVELDLTAPETVEGLSRVALARAELPPGSSLRALVRPPTWDRLVA